ncbi:hypothetical protein [Amycolatopsis sp. NPDC051372]|uniref:hypothetical protein n=1 Tax=unclassified Amycolatopsis TaxID=2618356 RepID=UPI00342718FA
MVAGLADRGPVGVDLGYSSLAVFEQAAAALRAALGAKIAGSEPENAVRAVVSGW